MDEYLEDIRRSVKRIRLFGILLVAIVAGSHGVMRAHYHRQLSVAEAQIKMLVTARDVLILFVLDPVACGVDRDLDRPDLQQELKGLPFDPRLERLAKAVVAYRERQPGSSWRKVQQALRRFDREIGL